MSQELTRGQKLVGLTFNPSGREDVTKAKQQSADLIDQVLDEHDRVTISGEQPASWERNVLKTEAVNAVLRAQQAVVKVLTWSE